MQIDIGIGAADRKQIADGLARAAPLASGQEACARTSREAFQRADAAARSLLQ